MSEPPVRWPAWIGVVADDLEGQRRFYREVMGFHEDEVGDGWVQFDMGDGRLFELLARDPSVAQYAERRYQVGFTVADIHNPVYNPGGRLRAEEYTFPYPSEAFGFAVLKSVFTHLLPTALERYLAEIV